MAQQFEVERTQGGVGAVGGQIVEAGAEHRFRSDGFESESVLEQGIVAVEIDIVEIRSRVAVQADLRQKDVAVGDGVGAARLKVFGQVALCKVAEDHAAQMIPGG